MQNSWGAILNALLRRPANNSIILKNVALINGEIHACPRCASTDVQKRGVQRTSVSTFQRYQCNDCGAWSRAGKNLAKTELR